MAIEGWVPWYIYNHETKAYERRGRVLVRGGTPVSFETDEELDAAANR